MKQALGGPIFLAVGALAGIVSAMAAVNALGSSPVRPGSPWQSWDTPSAAGYQPYAAAHYLLGGRLPPVTGQMREMAAERDSDGAALSSACGYAISGHIAARSWWSLATVTGGVATPTVAGLMTSDTAILESDGALVVRVSASPQPGNWITPPAASSYSLLFTLVAKDGSVQRAPLPDLTVSKVRC